MFKNERGFTLVELMITVVVFLLAMVAGSRIFIALVTQFKQQSKIAEADVESTLGLDTLRRDLAHLGYGLPWNYLNLIAGGYLEAAADNAAMGATWTTWLTITSNDAPSAAPRAIVSGPGLGLNNSDVFAVKTINASMASGAQNPAQKSTYIYKPVMGAIPNNLNKWTSATDNLVVTVNPPADYVMIMDPGAGSTTPQNALMTNVGGADTFAKAGTFYTTLADTNFTFNGSATPTPFEPPATSQHTYLVYGLIPDDGTTKPRMPFNRADYYVKIPTVNTVARCAPNTGILYKGVLNHNINNNPTPPSGQHTEYPLMDCVAYMQVDYWLDTLGNGAVTWPPVSDISGLTADVIRAQLKEVRVYILTHEGQRDPNFDFSQGGTVKNLFVIEASGINSRTLTFPPPPADLSTIVGADYKYYRWKVYTLAVQPTELQ